MRPFLIRFILPTVLCVVPLLAASLVIVAAPAPALQFYLQRIRDSHYDWIILGVGLTLFTVQLVLAWWALRWQGPGFDERPDRWLTNLAQAAEWFPLLGLIGTVLGILETFGQIALNPHTSPTDIIRAYAPAITATGSGLFMALLNLLPSWLVLLGRDLLLTLAGPAQPTDEAAP